MKCDYCKGVGSVWVLPLDWNRFDERTCPVCAGDGKKQVNQEDEAAISRLLNEGCPNDGE